MRLRLRTSSGLALALVLAPLAPLPGVWRATAAISALLLAWPLALWPLSVPVPSAVPRADELPPELARQVRGLAWWPVAGALPLLLLSLPGFLGVSLTYLLGAWLVGFAICLGLGLRHAGATRAPVEPVGRAARWGLVVALALLVFFVASRGAPLGAMDDAYDHLATVRHLVETGRLELPGAFYARDVPHGADPRKGVLHVGLALAARLARVDALTVWRAAPPLLALLAGLAFAGLALALFRRWSFAILTLPGLLVLGGDPGRLVRGAYGGHWGLVVAWAGMALALAGGGFYAGVLAGLAAASVHAYSPAQLLTPLTGFALATGLAGRPRPAGLLAFLGGALVGAVPVDLARVLISAHSGNPLHEQAMPWLLLPAGPVASPLEILRAWGLPGAIAAVALLVVLLVRRERIGLFLFGAWLTPLLLLLNPWMFRPVADRLGSVANKLLLCWDPALALPGIALILLLNRADRRPLARVGMAVAWLILIGGLLVTVRGRSEYLLAPSADSLPAQIRDATLLAAEATPESAVVASDPLTAYALPALSGRRSIVTLQQHSPPGDDRALERIAVSAALYSTCVPLESALRSAVEEGADYLLVGRQPPVRIDQFGNHPDPRNEAQLARRFRERPDLLQEVGHRGGAVLYRIVPTGPGAGQPLDSPSSPTEAVVPANRGVGQGLRVREGTVEVGFPTPPGGPWARGAAASLPVEWTRLAAGAHYEEYSAHIRFENVAMPVLHGLAAVFSKPLRRMYLERRAGGVYRARAVESPFGGLCPAAGWTIGQVLPDTLRFVVPAGILPGTYRLRVALERGTLYPVLKPADLLRDEDRFSGPVLGTLEIQ